MPGNNSIEEWAAKSAEGQAANLEAADAARHLGALAFYDNTNQALAAYRKAVGLDAGNPDGWNQLGHLLVRITHKLKTALALVDIRVLDHILVGGMQTVSFAEKGLL